MTRFREMQIALEFLNRPELKSVGSNLSDYIQGLTTDYFTSEGYPKAIEELFTLKLTYSVLKNRAWCGSEQFRAILVQDFAEYFGVRSDFCHALVTKVCLELSNLIQLPMRFEGNRYYEFLFIKIATCTDLRQIEDELGVGQQIIKRIKQYAQNTFSKKHKMSSDSFQHSISELVVKYAARMKSIPWAMDIARLEFILPHKVHEWPQLASETGYSILFDLLMAMSEAQRLRGSELYDKYLDLRAAYGASAESVNEVPLEELLSLLSNSRLMYQETTRKTDRSSFYCLAELGFELTANAYAYENKLDIERNPYRLLEIEEPYQIQLLKLMTRESLVKLSEILDQDYALSRGAIRVFAERMSYINESEKLCDILTLWMNKHPSYWIREAAVAATDKLSQSDKIRLSLQDVAKSDPSCAVQNKAIELLMKQ